MRYVLDRCANDKSRAALKAQGYDCIKWSGARTAPDKEIAAFGEARDRVVISDDVGFVKWRRAQTVATGYHVHLVGRKKDQPALLKARMADIEAKIKGCGQGVFIVDDDKPVEFEKVGGGYNPKRGKKGQAPNVKAPHKRGQRKRKQL
jgi:hypothetical protein